MKKVQRTLAAALAAMMLMALAGAGSHRRTDPRFRSCRKSRLPVGCRPEHPDAGGIRFRLHTDTQRNLPRPRLVQVRFAPFRGYQAVPDQ